MRLTTFIYINLVLTMVGCGQMQVSPQGFDSGSAIIEKYSTFAVRSAAAASGAPDPGGLGDVSSLSDEELLEKYKEKLTSDLERLKNSILEAQARGVSLPAGLEEAVKKQEEEIAKILARLESDPDFRQQTIEHLRNVSEKQSTADSLPPDFCERFGDLLANGLVPEAIRPHVQKDYDQKCSDD